MLLLRDGRSQHKCAGRDTPAVLAFAACEGALMLQAAHLFLVAAMLMRGGVLGLAQPANPT